MLSLEFNFKTYLFFSFLIFCLNTSVSAQRNIKAKGVVLDSNKIAIEGANVLLIIQKDTVKTSTDRFGNYNFKNVKSNRFTIAVNSIGYLNINKSFKFEEGLKEFEIEPLILKPSGTMLDEVVVHGKPNPVRILQDTIEYNAAAFQVLDGDRVTDLLKQLPGVEVDFDDNVSAMGKGMTKLRVNGKDFFTNNVKDFISKLPASIVGKIQVIDDYGDEANFTGVKVGEPQKMLNIVTKANINKGIFGSLGVTGGSADVVSINGNANTWLDKLQMGTTFGLKSTANGAGESKSANGNINLRKQLKNKSSIAFNYNVNLNDNDSFNSSFVESLNTLGKIYTENEGFNNSKNSYQNLNFNYQLNHKKNLINVQTTVNYSDGKSVNSSKSNQTGIIRQDLKNESNSNSNTPSISGNLSWSRKLAKKGSALSAQFNFSGSLRNQNQNILSNTLYYHLASGVLAKDSVLNRLIKSENWNNNVSGSVMYSHALKQPKDSLASRNINANYNFSIGNNQNDILTYVTNKENQLMFVDSLSTQYTSLFLSQDIGLNYSYQNKKITYVIGGSFKPNTLLGDYENLGVKITNTNYNYAPTFNFSYRTKANKTFSMRYNGASNSPTQNQLQPVKNTQNLQNIIIGNPNLKQSFNHTLGFSFNQMDLKSGQSTMLSLSGSVTSNQIISNVVLIRDTLNSLKQETSYLNADGSHSLFGMMNYMRPIIKNKWSISGSGAINYNRNVIITDHVKSFNYSLSFRPSFTSTLNLKKSSIAAGLSYNYNSNTNNLVKSTARTVHTFNYNLNFRGTILKNYKITTSLVKTINNGFTLANTNPLIMNFSINRTLLKNKALNIKFDGFDLFKQGNNLSRYINGNTIVDSRTNQLTRYFTLGLNYNLSKFGGGNSSELRNYN